MWSVRIRHVLAAHVKAARRQSANIEFRSGQTKQGTDAYKAAQPMRLKSGIPSIYEDETKLADALSEG